jgi:hypothetical protein
MPEGLGTSWEDTNRGPYIRTYSGRKVFLANPRPEDFALGDVARHLAGINRYTGGSRYTVAQHCVAASEMAKLFYPNEELLPARMLIHDVDEAYYGDVSSPLKSLLPDYRKLEEKAQLAVEKRFDLLFIGDPLVKEVDYRMWLTEREYLTVCGGPATNDYTGPLKPFDLPKEYIHYFIEWPAEEAETEWLACYRRLFHWQR